MQTILITGSHGQLGNEMQQAAARFPAFRFIYTDVEELDICDKAALDAFVKANAVNVIVNCAAYTAVDKAEDDVELCYKINAEAVRNIGEVAHQNGLKVVHVSTDYVFDGTNYMPYSEDQAVSPNTVYGKSKLAGEQALMETCEQAVILRTAWLYSSFGNNFVKTMIKLGTERDSLNVIFDQIGSPTYAADLADAILKLLSHPVFVPGIYHFSDEGVCSWYDFTKTIHRIAGITCDVHPIETKDYPARTPRPHYSVLNKSKIKTTYGIVIPHWEESLERCMKILMHN
ncbi:dTDP-4-dehydrorhamnose reductase [Paludibacter propionicigenes WB4]|uniref:dTDP-4-dehydrorhamnose reductase n=1 Tax=Paludibacter propionicigenes (strain DSM 17365 / JCM 13257 / WB4) TaxID=694427 RepID=E4T3R9_PALPW|nr:dTDP-4-dehydrorhamnose reductase [Paludibacter propionicigenes]ADQ79363.1 dTDP-4-dehydrorhamnose reductase [Paludibacter propionicigenes WB4]